MIMYEKPYLILIWSLRFSFFYVFFVSKKGKGKAQRVPQSQAATLLRHQEEEETDKTKQAQIEQTYEKH